MAKKKNSKPSIFDSQDDGVENFGVEVKPENAVGLFMELGKLPDDWCPYGTGYVPERSKFIGDEEPYPHKPKQYREWEVINDRDPDLTPIYFTLPSPPKDLSLIDNYGLEPDEQYFRRLEIPKKLKILEKKSMDALYAIERRNRQDTIQGYKIYLKYWELFESEVENLTVEIEWLKNVWWYRKYGYWFYNDGEPTYLPPDYFDFLNFYFIDEAQCYPEYRDDRRRVHCFARYLESCTETFVNIDAETGKAIKGEDGKYEMIDLGRRLFFGDAEPKTRRKGNTHEATGKILKESTTRRSYFSTIISFEGNNAQIHYTKKLLPAFDRLPMCIKPMWEGSRRPTVLRLDAPPNVYHARGLGSVVMFSDSGGLFKNEGDRLNGLLNDEQGKKSNLGVNIFERWNINKLTMATGMGLNILDGVYVKNPSTIEEMESFSDPYYRMCMMSCFYNRIPHKGQTASGFARVFMPAYFAMEGFIDRFGKSVWDTPTERQIRLTPYAIFAKSKKGARQMFQAERDALIAENTPQSLETYRSIRRKSPFNWAECWLGTAGSVGFNLVILDKRLGEINREKSFDRFPYKVGNLRRIGNKDSNVVFEEERENGKFKISMELAPELTNRRTQEMGFDASKGMFVPMWKPIGGDYFTLGADPFQYMNKNLAKLSMVKSRQSDGGIAILYNNGKEKHFVLSYRNRPASQYEYMEDAIMACQYFCCMCYPETNINDLWKHFIERGYGGYLLYQIDIKTGKLKDKPGEFTGLETRDGYFTAVKDYIEFYGATESHDDILKEFRDIQGPDDMTHKDLFTAAALALRGDMTRYRQVMEMQNSMTIDLDGIGVFRKRRF